jgi:hypothetical protein
MKNLALINEVSLTTKFFDGLGANPFSERRKVCIE